ncbi:MAG TPA: sterol desaturase family protein [Candidatus Eisenbacteria bacterium]|nr:sterol desaturase family protein [Candidatus Eisenbacteria bacterium]
MARVDHAPPIIRHDEEPIRLFKSDLLEFFTHIHPATVLLLFVPVVLFFLARGFETLGGMPALGELTLVFGTGVAVWTLTEYVMHRYVFHYEPKGRFLQRVWFLIHGVHHEQPQCKTRLVMPPILSIPLAFGFYALFHVGLGVLLGAPQWVAPLYAGFVTGYLAYDMLHYAEHHLPMKGGALRYLKRYHLLHHFKTPDDRFGVSSPLWDVIFGTLPKDRKRG